MKRLALELFPWNSTTISDDILKVIHALFMVKWIRKLRVELNSDALGLLFGLNDERANKVGDLSGVCLQAYAVIAWGRIQRDGYIKTD